MNEFLLYFATAGACLLVAHPIGDYFVQTDHQAQHKGLRGHRTREGRLNCFVHALTYTFTHIAVMFTVFLLAEYDGPYLLVGCILALNGLTHYVIDRRWTLEWFARDVLGKSGWIDNDPTALATLDQAAHRALFLPVAVAIAAVSI
jgi:hypothetical protein